MERKELAASYFKNGYNCAQSVAFSFNDVMKLDDEVVLKSMSSFGAGMGRLREVCGAVSGMIFAAGIICGYSSPKDHKNKTEHYKRVQELSKQFKDMNGSYICRELLFGVEHTDGVEPEKRSKEYYKKRPCIDLVRDAAELLDNYLRENKII